VRQGRGLHGPLGVRVESGPDTDGEPTEQRRAGLRQVGGDVEEGRPGRRGGPEQAVRWFRDGDAAAAEQDERGDSAGVVLLQLSADLDERAGRHDVLPRLVECRHEPDGNAQVAVPGGSFPDRQERPDHGPVAGRQVAVEVHVRLRGSPHRLEDDRWSASSLSDRDGDGRQPDEQRGGEHHRGRSTHRRHPAATGATGATTATGATGATTARRQAAPGHHHRIVTLQEDDGTQCDHRHDCRRRTDHHGRGGRTDQDRDDDPRHRDRPGQPEVGHRGAEAARSRSVHRLRLRL
jgi:hypothetical protein